MQSTWTGLLGEEIQTSLAKVPEQEVGRLLAGWK